MEEAKEIQAIADVEEVKSLMLDPPTTAVNASLRLQKMASRDNLPINSVITAVAPIKKNPTRLITPPQVKTNGTNTPIFPRSLR